MVGKPTKIFGTSLLFCFVFSCQPSIALSQIEILEAKVTEVVDGDTIWVRLPTKEQKIVRYQCVNAPERGDILWEEALKENKALVEGKTVWLEVFKSGQEFKQEKFRSSEGRILAYVFLDENLENCVNALLVKSGYLRIDVRNVGDDTPDNDFAIRHIPKLLEAQIGACKERRGWWKEADKFRDSDIAIAFIKFWGEEVVYLVNRGKEPIDLSAGWMIFDRDKKNVINLARTEAPKGHILQPHWVCRVFTGRYKKEIVPLEMKGEIVLFGQRKRIWDNGEIEEAYICDKNGQIRYVYTYNPRGG
ncbi:MAG: thermonuclease family protein [Armatimonadetes bacterium]|nr:thermonuclease family protein [Armatimonadota bacterium]